MKGEASNVGTKRHRYLKVKYGKMVAVVTAMQNWMGDKAAAMERVQHLFTWCGLTSI